MEKTQSNQTIGKYIEVEGVVTEVLPGLEYKVKINFNGIEHELLCYVSGKMRTNYIQLSKGDSVKVEVSLYDINKGRITYRLSKFNEKKPAESVQESD